MKQYIFPTLALFALLATPVAAGGAQSAQRFELYELLEHEPGTHRVELASDKYYLAVKPPADETTNVTVMRNGVVVLREEKTYGFASQVDWKQGTYDFIMEKHGWIMLTRADQDARLVSERNLDVTVEGRFGVLLAGGGSACLQATPNETIAARLAPFRTGDVSEYHLEAGRTTVIPVGDLMDYKNVEFTGPAGRPARLNLALSAGCSDGPADGHAPGAPLSVALLALSGSGCVIRWARRRRSPEEKL